MTKRLLKLLRPILLGLLLLGSPAFAAFDAAQFERDLATLAGVQSRAIGSKGYDDSFEYIKAQIKAMPGVRLQEHTYDVMAPQTRESTLTIGGRSVAVYPFFPASIRLNTTPIDGIQGKLVYCGSGGYIEIPPADVAGNIAVIEASAGEDWKAVAYFGARAILVLPGKGVSHVNLRSHEVTIPINIPRFYLADEALAEQIRTRSVAAETATLKVLADWKRVTARNLYAYVSPKDPLPEPLDKKGSFKAWSALTILTQVDTSGLVYDLSPAAGQAVQPAAALGMLRDYANNPPPRPVMVAFTGADSMSMIGTRQMLMAFGDAPQKWRDVIADEIDPQIKEIEADLEVVRSLNGDPTKLDIARHRTLIDRIVKIIDTDIALEQDELFRIRILPPEQQNEAKTARLKELEDRQLRLGQLKFRFTSKPGDLSQLGEEAKAYFNRVLTRLGGTPGVEGLRQEWGNRKAALLRRIELYQWLARNINSEQTVDKFRHLKLDPGAPRTAVTAMAEEIDLAMTRLAHQRDDLPLPRSENPSPRSNNDRLIELLVGLDISDLGERVGPMYWGRYIYQSSITQIQEHREWFEKITGKAKIGDVPAPWFVPIANVVDFESLKLSRTPLSYLNSPIALPAEMGLPWGIPAMSMTTMEDLRPRRDTPADTLANLKVSTIIPQINAVHELFRNAWNDPKFVGQPEYRRNTNEFEGQIVSTASGKPIPDLPREGFLATYTFISGPRKIPQIRSLAYSVGVRRTEVVDCDSEGRYFFDGLPRLGDLKQMIVKVYRTRPGSGEIVATTDLGKQASDLKQTVNLDQEVTPVKSVVFDSQEFTLNGLYDPRFLQSLGEVQMMDARRNAEPQRFDAMVSNQMMVGALEPGSRAYLLFRYGRIGNRIVLLNMPGEGEPRPKRAGVRGEGEGFLVENLSSLGPLAMVTARDFYSLNDSRIRQYKKAGVESTLINEMHQQAGEELKQADVSLKANNADSMMKSATGAWANEARVYDAVQKMANDVIYAAIFLLLLAVPFSFCMERLLAGSPNIYRQIAGAFLVFAIMAAALWLFHPAFKISSSPLIIILAFAIILMSVVVISVVYSKFDSELKRIRSGRGSAEGASFARASVLMSAIMLGIANMRRRKFRTALTAITVVLITFAVLCFTSASRYQSTISLPTGIDSDYAGLLLRQRGFRNMPVEAIDSLKSVYPDKTLVERWWTVDAWDPKAQVHLLVGGFDVDGKAARILPMPALLGLTPGESQLSPIGQVVSNFDRLEKGETNIIYLAHVSAEQLKVKVGDTLQIAGIPLEVAGLYDANDFDQRVTTLSGEPIAPLKYSSGALDASGRRLTDASVDTLDLDADSSAAEAGASYEHLPASQFAIVPAAISRQIDNTTLRTVGMRLAADDEKPADKDAKVKLVVEDITKRFALATFAGYSDGVKLVSASNLSSIGGGANVAIPLAIGGLIIFNTMMGSIAERRREIHVYTSLGLAPLHVGALFVAEALTYGLIGSVFGYIIGQGVGTAMLKLGWLGNVTLNYSGSSAMLTLGLILLIVLLSALVPARLASKIAAPSIERSWRVPAPVGDQILAGLPFTINQTAAQGVVAYLAEFFEAHQEGSIGKFSAGKIEAFAGTSGDGKPTRGLKTVVWLTPFDLGVRQHLLLLIHPGEFEDIYEVQVVLQRLSGDDSSWWRMNRSFLTELRKQFLQWRSLSPQRMKDYVEESKKLFAEVPTDVVATDTSEEIRLA